MKHFREMSETEQEIMEVLWESAPKTLNELRDLFANQRGKVWKPQTLATFISRLVEKELIIWEQRGRARYYSPALTKAEYEGAKAKTVLDTLFDGSLQSFVAALYDGDALSEQDIAEMKEWVESK
ncbi:MAG: BlaI/MecI/CopY family transcriptional regulator [Oscillospiraceae bacterium]|nr:BlaI/MecI/CopY family transcriptional regulator [Oscillospiraceae bacterium]